MFTVSKKDFNLYPGAPAILNKFEDDIHVKEELLECIVGVNTGICQDVAGVRSDLMNKIAEVQQQANEEGTDLVSIGTHPFATWKDQTVTSSPPLYKVFGTDAVACPPAHNLRSPCSYWCRIWRKSHCNYQWYDTLYSHPDWFISQFTFFDKELTGLVSTRTKIFEGLPTAGLPPILKNYSEFKKFMRTLQKADSIQSIREVWWDIRPHPGFGTV